MCNTRSRPLPWDSNRELGTRGPWSWGADASCTVCILEQPLLVLCMSYLLYGDLTRQFCINTQLCSCTHRLHSPPTVVMVSLNYFTMQLTALSLLLWRLMKLIRQLHLICRIFLGPNFHLQRQLQEDTVVTNYYNTCKEGMWSLMPEHKFPSPQNFRHASQAVAMLQVLPTS